MGVKSLKIVYITLILVVTKRGRIFSCLDFLAFSPRRPSSNVISMAQEFWNDSEALNDKSLKACLSTTGSDSKVGEH